MKLFLMRGGSWVTREWGELTPVWRRYPFFVGVSTSIRVKPILNGKRRQERNVGASQVYVFVLVSSAPGATIVASTIRARAPFSNTSTTFLVLLHPNTKISIRSRNSNGNQFQRPGISFGTSLKLINQFLKVCLTSVAGFPADLVKPKVKPKPYPAEKQSAGTTTTQKPQCAVCVYSAVPWW